jgi:hypothetical protein
MVVDEENEPLSNTIIYSPDFFEGHQNCTHLIFDSNLRSRNQLTSNFSKKMKDKEATLHQGYPIKAEEFFLHHTLCVEIKDEENDGIKVRRHYSIKR